MIVDKAGVLVHKQRKTEAFALVVKNPSLRADFVHYSKRTNEITDMSAKGFKTGCGRLRINN